MTSKFLSPKTVLVGDVGGTNTRLLLFQVDSRTLSQSLKLGRGERAPGILLSRKLYQNSSFASFTELLVVFLEESNQKTPPVTACIAVAGPVTNNSVTFTNRADWNIDGFKLAKELKIVTVKLVNDFVAAGYGLLTLNEDTECVSLQNVKKDPTAPIVCIGAGTGLGECYLTPTKAGDYICYPSEGGHAEFAPRNDTEIEMLSYLKAKFQQQHRVSVERVVSGTGLWNIYEFLSSFYPNKVQQTVHDEISAAGDLKGAIISKYKDSCELCRQTMEIFIRSYGAEAGVAGLKWLPFGGLYLTGGLTPRCIDLITDANGHFMTSFRDKGRVSAILNEIPVYAVTVEDLGERGAHRVAYEDLIAAVSSEEHRSASKISIAVLASIVTAVNVLVLAVAIRSWRSR